MELALAAVALSIIDQITHSLFGGVFETIDLIVVGFKIIVLLFIISFVRNRFGGGTIATILTLVIGYIVLFQPWDGFGPLFFVYLFIIFGFTAILFDIAITKPWHWGSGGGGAQTGGLTGLEEEEHMSGRELKENMERQHKMREAALRGGQHGGGFGGGYP